MKELIPVLLGGLVLVSTACDAEDSSLRSVDLRFAANVAGEAVDCSVTYANLGSTDADAQIADARFFISNVELMAGGEWTSLQLVESEWQQDGVALLDFENGEDACADSGTSETNDTVSGDVVGDDIAGLRFDLGIPFELNHTDQASAPAPFNVPGMFWTWQGGYKFVRVDFAVDGDTPSRWNVHIGSTGCVSDAPTESPEEACGRPNLATIELEDFDPDQDTVALDLAALIADADITTNVTDSPPGCMSNPAEGDDCDTVFEAIGLGFTDGECDADCAAQTAFLRMEME